MEQKWQSFLERYALYGIFAFAVIFYFFSAGKHDLLSDDALYSFRALGWFDYVGGTLQTAPIQWFGSVPWWANLSFHDAPPLVFAVQFLFFSIFGMSVFVAKLPFAIAGIAVIFILYKIFSDWRGKKSGILAALFMAVSAYAAWMCQAGYLESIETLFLVLATFFFLRYVKEETLLGAAAWGSFLGLALLSKYTAIFLPTGFFLYLILWRRDLFARKSLWFGVICIIVVLIPVIIYNANVYVARGHFDAALSSMVGMHPDDFKIIAGRSISTNFFANAGAIPKILSGMTSPPFFIVTMIGVLFLFIKVIRRRGDALDNIFFCLLVSAFPMFLFMGASERFLYIIVPFSIAAVVLFIYDFFIFLHDRRPHLVSSALIIVIAIVGFELLYAVNGNWLIRPLNTQTLFLQNSRMQSVGFNELSEFIKKEIFPGAHAFKRPHVIEDINRLENESFKNNILLFDETMSWSPYVWYIQPYSMYYRLPVISLTNYLQIIPEGSDPLEKLAATGAPGMYYIFGASDHVVDPVKGENKAMRSLEKAFAEYLEENGFLVEVIKDPSGDTAFKIYHVVFERNEVVE